MQHKVELSGVDTAKLPVLKNEETQQLLRLTREGDAAAREKLIAGNLRLVLSVIQRFSNRGENLDDLFQVGCIGLIKSIDNFELDRGLRLSTYAVPMICSLGKRKESSPKCLKSKGFQLVLDFQSAARDAIRTSAREITRTRIGI